MSVMYKALYNFESQDSSALSFSENDQFTVLDSNDEHWWLVQNGRGQVGYVPANYLTKSEAGAKSNAHGEVLRSIDRAIETIQQQAASTGGQYNTLQKSNLQKLQHHRQNVLDEQKQQQQQQQQQQLQKRSSQKRTAPEPPSGSGKGPPSTSGTQDSAAAATTQKKQDAKRSSVKKMSSPPPPAPSANQTQPTKDEVQPAAANQNNTATPSQSAPPKEARVQPMSYVTPRKASSRSAFTIPETLGSELVEKVRKNTNLSYELSHLAVGSVLEHVGTSVPQLEAAMGDILKTLRNDKAAEANDLELTHDGKRLQKIFEELAACKDDSQQRSWFLHEDEAAITGHLEELLSILTNANPDVCKQVVAQDHYEAVDNLVLYYQMETRVSIRMWLLQCFGGLCGLEGTVISALLNSVLPLELARDMQSDTQDIQRLTFSALVLTMIFSMGEAVPVQYYDHLNTQLIEFLLTHIESPPENDTGDQIPDLFLKLILAFNLHLELPSENMVMKVLAETGTAKTFTEKLMLLVNRGDDPVRMFEHEPCPPDSLLKFLADMYSSPSTSTLLYTNDEMVLIDIILRHLADLSPGDKARTEYLSLIHLIFRNSNYPEHQHRRSELDACFDRICNEEERESQMDRHIVRQIFLEFPDLFTG